MGEAVGETREGHADVTLLFLSLCVALLSVLRWLGSLWPTLVPTCSTVAVLHGCAPGRGGLAWEQGMGTRALVSVHLPVALGPSRSSEHVAGIVVLVIFNFLMVLLAAALLAVHFKPWVFLPSVVRIMSQGALTSVAIKQMT